MDCIKERLMLYNTAGDLPITVYADVDLDAMQTQLIKAWETVSAAQVKLRETPNDETAQEAYGSAVLGMFPLIFDDDGAKEILDFYNGDYTGMLLNLFPFLNTVILPRIAAASARRKAQLMTAAREGSGR